jgi:beta-lactamase class A
MGCQYAFYYRSIGNQPFYQSNCTSSQQLFSSASIIKVPILLAWIFLEREGCVDRTELCTLDDEPQVQGAGFSWLLRARQLPYQDVLLLMMALSDNLCTNLVIRRAGLDRLNQVFQQLGLADTHLQRKLLDFEARARGLDNWICAGDCIHLFRLLEKLTPEERAWVDGMLAVNQDTSLLVRQLPRDTLVFHHKTGSLSGVLHDWGYTAACETFLLTQGVKNELAASEIFGQIGRQVLVENE